MKLYTFDVISPRIGNARTHACRTYHVMAPSFQAAKAALIEREDLTQKHLIRGNENGETGVTIVRNFLLKSYSREQVQQLNGNAPKPKKQREVRLSNKPLGDTQTHVLRSLSKAPYPGGGWIWDNHSGTVRILESLRLRGLADRGPRNNYSINAAGLAEIDKLGGGV